MILGAWRRSWLAYIFDRETGRWRRRLVKLGERIPASGFGAIETTREHGRVFFALYRFDGRIVFQAGTRRFAFDDPAVNCSFRVEAGGRSSEFTVVQSNEVAFRCTYRHWFRPTSQRRDPLHESLNFEAQHFLAYVAGLVLPISDFDTWEDAALPPVKPMTAEEALAGIPDPPKSD